MTQRDLRVAFVAAACAVGVLAVAEQVASFKSAAYDWNSIPEKSTNVGSVRSFFKMPTSSLEQLEVHVTTLNPGMSPHPPHRHPNEEMIIIRQGTLEVLVNGDWKRVGSGSVVLFESNQLHGLRNVGTEKAIYHVINWKTPATPAAVE